MISKGSICGCKGKLFGAEVFKVHKRTMFAKISLMDHLCDPMQHPKWHTQLSQDIRLLPEVQEAIKEFHDKRWAQCQNGIQRVLDIIASIPNLSFNKIPLSFGLLHCALERNLHIIDPSQWKVLAEDVLVLTSSLMSSQDAAHMDHHVYAAWITFATLTMKTSASTGFKETTTKYIEILRSRSSELTRRVELLDSLVHLTKNGGKEIYPSAMVNESTQYTPSLFGNDQSSSNIMISNYKNSEELVDFLALFSAETFRSIDDKASSGSIFRMLFSPNILQTNCSPRQKKLQELTTDIALAMHGLSKNEMEKLTESPIVLSNCPKIPAHLFISTCLSNSSCPLVVLQRALKHCKAIPNEYAETRNILMATVLRALALHYQYNYVYFSGLYNSAMIHLENWLRHDMKIRFDLLDSIVNRLMRSEYVRLLVDLGQKKEADSLVRRHNMKS